MVSFTSDFGGVAVSTEENLGASDPFSRLLASTMRYSSTSLLDLRMFISPPAGQAGQHCPINLPREGDIGGEHLFPLSGA